MHKYVEISTTMSNANMYSAEYISLAHSLIHSLSRQHTHSLTHYWQTHLFTLTFRWNNFYFRLYLAQYQYYNGCVRI